MLWRKMTLVVVAGSAFAIGACSGSEGGDETDPANNGANNGKGDTPTGAADQLCLDRQEDTTSSVRPGFTRDAIRWSCADVEGVNTANMDDRGQEYCEYFAIIQAPNQLGEGWEEKGLVMGRPAIGSSELRVCSSNSACESDEVCISVNGWTAPTELCNGRNCGLCAPVTTAFNEDQMFFLEDQGDEIVGKCVFTSWHSDAPGPLPCDGECATIYGHELTQDNFRMLTSINSNGAASDLVQQCVKRVAEDNYPKGDPENADDPLHQPFYRSCMTTADLFGTHWRFSDPSVCAAAVRAAECGCTVGGDASIDLGFALVPSIDEQMSKGGISLRGFPLGTWSGAQELPTGCRYVDAGTEANEQPSQTIVECDIPASALLQNLQDPKDYCRRQYGSDVVVHVPIPASAIVCEAGEGQYADSCSETPWVIEGPAPAGGE